MRLGVHRKCLHLLVCLYGCLHTLQGTVKFIFCDNFNFRSLFAMVIAFSRALSVAVSKNFLDLLFQRSQSRFLRGRVVDDDGRRKRFLLGYHRDQFSPSWRRWRMWICLCSQPKVFFVQLGGRDRNTPV